MRIVLVSLLVMLLCFGVVDGEEHGRLRQRRVGDAGEGATETDVVVIGAGAAGLSAAYTLNRSGIDYIVLEATERLGGRTQKDTSFAPYPLDIGASWVQRPYAIEKIVNPDGIQLSQLMSNFICYDLSNFVNYTYHDFINDYIAPKERRKILFGCRVNVVNYSNAKVLTVCEDGRWFLSEHVVVTVPLAILNQNVIKFYPALPDRLTVNHPGWMFGGFKMAIEFAKGFRGRQICFPDIMEANGDCLNRDGESYMWPISSIHDEDLIGGNVIMLGYIVGKPAEQFLGWNDENKIIGRVLELLDPKFNYMASKLYVKHKIWNWSEMPDFRGVYSNKGLFEGAQNVWDLERLWIAGEAFPTEDEENGWVDAAAFSGEDAAKQIIRLRKWWLYDGYDDTQFWRKVASDLGRD